MSDFGIEVFIVDKAEVKTEEVKINKYGRSLKVINRVLCHLYLGFDF